MSRLVDRIRRQFSDARPVKRAGLILLVLAAFSVVGASAWAYWTTHGIGSASASTGTLYAPGAPVASVTGPGTVHLTWNTSTLSNNTAAQGYYVTRSDAPATKICETSGPPTGVKSCDDTSVGQGTYTYKVTAVYGSWTASSGESNTIIGTTTTVSSSPSPSVAGETVLYTATVTQDSGVAPPTGSVTFKDGTSTIVCTGGSTTLSLGVATCTLASTGVGTHSITAVYSGDANFLTSTSSVLTQVINQTVSTSLAIATVVNDHGNIKVHFTGTGAAASTTITVTICALNSFPCAIPISVSTASNPPAGNWTSAQSSANLTAGTTYYAQAVQGTTSSAAFSFLPPP